MKIHDLKKMMASSSLKRNESIERTEPFATAPSSQSSCATTREEEEEEEEETGGHSQMPRKPRNPDLSKWMIRRKDAESLFEEFLERFDFERYQPAEIDLALGYNPHDLADQLWDLVAQDNHPPRLFLTDARQPVRLEVIERQPYLSGLTVDRLSHEVHRVADFIVRRKDSVRQQPCPHGLLTEMLGMPVNRIPLPRLRQLATAPMVGDETGRILFENGYYRDIGTYLYCPTTIESVSSEPSGEEVRRALAILRTPLQDFPFVGAFSSATAMAAMIAPFVRCLIQGPTPLHLIEKATPGTGASLLTDVLLTPAVGAAVQKLTTPNSEHEWLYSLTAVLRALPTAVVIDNARELGSPQLAKALTDDVMVARIVGSSETAVIPVRCVWLATGNNPILHQELARRVVRCRLDAGSEKPWLGRTFHIPNLKEWLVRNRSEMVWAILTLIRSWFAAGRPPGGRTLGMFESYSQVVGGILGHLGVGGFLDDEGLGDVNDEDLQTEAERWFVSQWWARHSEASAQVKDLLEMVAQVGSPVLEFWGPDAHSNSYGKRLGWFIRSIRDKTFRVEGLPTGRPGATVQVVRTGDDPVNRTARYRLQSVPKR